MRQIVLDIPHGGRQIVPELKSLLHPDIQDLDLLREADLPSDQIYQEQGAIPDDQKIAFDHLRTLIDANREEEDFSRDGVVKTHTNGLKQLYKDPSGIPHELAKRLVDQYARPHWARLEAAIRRSEVRFVLLSHTMQSVGPLGGVGPGQVRPLICLGNGGDSEGNTQKPYQLTRELMEFLRDEFRRKMGSLSLTGVVHNGVDVSFNAPFIGTRSIERIGPRILQGRTAILMEVNRSIFYDPKDPTQIARPENIVAFRTILHDALEAILGRITR